MTSQWRKLSTDQYPRKGELILVRNDKSIYPHLLIARGSLDWWWYKDTEKDNGMGSGTKLSFHGLTEWLLVGEV